MPVDLSKLSDEQLEAYQSLLAAKQNPDRRGLAPGQSPPGVPAPQLPDANSVKPSKTFSGTVLNDVAPPDSLRPTPPSNGSISVGNQTYNNPFTRAVGAGRDFINTGLTKLGHVLPEVANNRKSAAAADALEGAGAIYLPEALPSIATAPLTAAGATAGGIAGGAVGGGIARHYDASPDVERLSSDVGAIPGAILGGKATNLAARNVASGFANAALGTRPQQRQFGANPGTAALQETNGIKPATVAQSAEDRINAIMPVKDAHLANADPVPLGPARGAVASGRQLAATRGDAALDRELIPMQDTLARNQVTGEQYPDYVPAEQAQDILRGYNNQHTRFIEGRTGDANDFAKSSGGSLRDSINEKAPGVIPLNSRVQNLIPVRDLGVKANNLASGTETAINRGTRPTGGLAATLMGYHEGGVPGAIATMIGQESLGQPAVKMAIARALYGGVGGERIPVPEMPQRRLPAMAASSENSGPAYNWRNNPMEPPVRGLLGPNTAPNMGSEGRGGVNVPDIIGSSSRGEGTPVRLLSAPSEGTITRGNVDLTDPRSREILAPSNRGWIPAAAGQPAVEPQIISPRGQPVPNTPQAIKIPPAKTNPAIRVRNP